MCMSRNTLNPLEHTTGGNGMPEIRYFTVEGRDAPRALANDIVILGETAMVSGIRAADLFDDRLPLPESVEAQTRKIFSNLDVILEAAGLLPRRLLGVRIYLVDFERLVKRMDIAYLECIGATSLPARTCIGVNNLNRGALVEMDFIVHAPAEDIERHE